MTRVKICGITTLEDAQLAVELGAWALGMIFWPSSPRACAVEQAEAIGAQLHRRVELDRRVRERAARRGGRASPTSARSRCSSSTATRAPPYCAEAARRTGLQGHQGRARARRGAACRRCGVSATSTSTCSTRTRGRRRAAPARASTGSSPRLHRGTPPVILSGGLTPDNVAEAIAGGAAVRGGHARAAPRPSPGRKDPAKVTAFFRAVEQASLAAA